MYYCTKYPSPVGTITLVGDGEHLVGLWIEGQKHFTASIQEEMYQKDDLPVFDLGKKWLDRYFERKRPEIGNLPLAPSGTAFQMEVWRLLCEIPYGKVTTYGEIAKKIAERHNRPHMFAQAVGGAVGHNPISIIIPCHRVIGANGNLTGYAGGIEKKIQLLELEGVNTEVLTKHKT